MSDYLQKVEEQLRELTERGARSRRRVALGGAFRIRTDLLAFGAAAAVVVAVVAVVLGLHASTNTSTNAGAPKSAAARGASASSAATHHSAHARAAAAAPSRPRGEPITNFLPRSFTAISELTWWLLGDGPSIVRTDDGGRHFVRVTAPHGNVAQLRFADAGNGFAFGPSLYATHDGGRTWHSLHVGGQVTDLAIGGGEVYAIVSSQLLRAPVGSDSWTVLAHGVAAPLWVHGADVLVSSAGFTTLLLSHDRGATFASYHTPSPGLPCSFQEQAAPVVWAHCVTGTESAVWRSTDGGQSWMRTNCPSDPNSALFAAASSSTAVVGYQQLYRTGDTGNSYAAVGPSGTRWSYLGFTDATHGVALGTGGELYYTTDAGVSYHRVDVR